MYGARGGVPSPAEFTQDHATKGRIMNDGEKSRVSQQHYHAATAGAAAH